jgi:hypothetical protein
MGRRQPTSGALPIDDTEQFPAARSVTRPRLPGKDRCVVSSRRLSVGVHPFAQLLERGEPRPRLAHDGCSPHDQSVGPGAATPFKVVALPSGDLQVPGRRSVRSCFSDSAGPLPSTRAGDRTGGEPVARRQRSARPSRRLRTLPVGEQPDRESTRRAPLQALPDYAYTGHVAAAASHRHRPSRRRVRLCVSRALLRVLRSRAGGGRWTAVDCCVSSNWSRCCATLSPGLWRIEGVFSGACAGLGVAGIERRGARDGYG